MTTTLLLRFPLGRYHATPWARHVNEAEVELPPSPWRLLRALFATWRSRVPDVEEDVAYRVLNKLAAPPRFFIPPYTLSHTRHYFPDSKHKTGTDGGTDKTIDAFALFDPGDQLAVQWPVTLEPDEWKAFARWAEALPYLGRSESLCEAEAVTEWRPDARHLSCAPLDVAEAISETRRTDRVLIARQPLDLDCLIERTTEIRAGKLLYPPGTRFLAYEMSEPRPATTRQPARVASAPIQAIRYSLFTQAGPPPMSRTVTYTHKLRSAALSQLGKLRETPEDSLLAGRSAHGDRFAGKHGHAHYLAIPAVDDHRLTDLVIWIPAGLPSRGDEFIAIERIRTLFGKAVYDKAPPETRLGVSAWGAVDSVIPDFIGPATQWTSVTPFIPSGRIDAKRGWRRHVAQQIRCELRYRFGTDYPEVTVDDCADQPDGQRFERKRPGQRHESPPAAMLTLRFATPMTGPLILGQLAHFGLGLFRPVTNT